jgi:hypothetical protein
MVAPEDLLKIPAKLWAVVGLNHMEVKAKFVPSVEYYLCS